MIEESQKIKRENLNFLTNIFGKATSSSNTKIKKLMPIKNLNFKAKASANDEKPKNKLVRFNSKFWNKKKSNLIFPKRGTIESPKNLRKISMNQAARIKSKINDTIGNLDKTPNGISSNTNSNKDRNLNDSSYETCKYEKIFNAKNFQGKTLNYDKFSETSTINNEKG